MSKPIVVIFMSDPLHFQMIDITFILALKRPVKKKPEHGSQVVLTVSDDGGGLPDGFDISKSTSLGMQLVKTLSEQIDGVLQIRPGQGTHFAVRFEAETGEEVGDLRGRKLSPELN